MAKLDGRVDHGRVMVGLIAFAGALLGSMLGYLSAACATRVERLARHREEWGRRFTHALEMSLSDSAQARRPGIVLPVTEEQVLAANLLIKFEGSRDLVDPLIVAIADSEPMSEAAVAAALEAASEVRQT